MNSQRGHKKWNHFEDIYLTSVRYDAFFFHFFFVFIFYFFLFCLLCMFRFFDFFLAFFKRKKNYEKKKNRVFLFTVLNFNRTPIFRISLKCTFFVAFLHALFVGVSFSFRIAEHIATDTIDNMGALPISFLNRRWIYIFLYAIFKIEYRRCVLKAIFFRWFSIVFSKFMYVLTMLLAGEKQKIEWIL